MKAFLIRNLERLDLVGAWVGLLSVRLLLAWEFFESGSEKFRGINWFADVADRFPFPFNIVPVDLSWQMATWFELFGAFALLIGFATRFFAASLFILTIVAIASVHWPESWMSFGELARGYALTDMGYGNFKLPVLFLVMLLPLMLSGAGRLSLDAWFRLRLAATDGHHAGHDQCGAKQLPRRDRFA